MLPESLLAWTFLLAAGMLVASLVGWLWSLARDAEDCRPRP
jgi:hypothetical protein